MSIQTQITEDIKAAMKAREKEKLEALRAVKTAFTLSLSEKGAATEIDNTKAIQIITKLVKQRKDSAQIYKEQNRPELSEKELFEAGVLEEYLPAMMSGEELKKALREIIAEVGAASPSEMGKVMGVATKKLAGKADNKMVSQLVRGLLAD